MTDRNEAPRVVVLGGGYAGALAANHLRTRDDVARACPTCASRW